MMLFSDLIWLTSVVSLCLLPFYRISIHLPNNFPTLPANGAEINSTLFEQCEVNKSLCIHTFLGRDRFLAASLGWFGS